MNHQTLVRQAAAEGMVLLKNENQMLPLLPGEHVAVFGRIQLDTYRSGTGSGGDVFVEHSVDLQEGMRNCPDILWDHDVMETYQHWCIAHPFDNGGGGWAAEPWHQEEMPLTSEWVQKAAQNNQKALIIIGRTAGEDKDNSDVAGSYRLTEQELEMMHIVCSHFHHVAVILNVANIIDMHFMQDPVIAPALRSVLYAWQGGVETGHAIVDILTGKVNPSGKLSATIALQLDDYPSTPYYGNASRNIYTEDIFVGYRYFETFAPEKVLYPFGYGLSYTQFELSSIQSDTNWDKKQITITGVISNIGKEAGKEVIQVYTQAPSGKLGKAKKVLTGFTKTECILPGQNCPFMITIPFNRLASYDDCGATGYKSAWILEAGLYQFYIGTDCHCTQQIPVNSTWNLSNTLLLEQLEEALTPTIEACRMVQTENGPQMAKIPTRTYDLKQRMLNHQPAEYNNTRSDFISLRQVYEGSATVEELVAQLTDNELFAIVRGEGMSSPKVTAGTASAFGGVTSGLLKRQIPVVCTSDGPSGIRMAKIKPVTQLPIGTSLACSFNLSLVETLYAALSQEMHQHEIDTLLGPGMNIQRSPLNGRNFEYFSEDPLVTGQMAIACIKGIQKYGGHATLKHFACNNQEWKRHEVEAIVSERALREIYLKGFEIAVREGHAKAIMTTYNPLNGYWNASNYDLLTTVLRQQWGFDGIVMTDWWAAMNDVIEGGPSDARDLASMIFAQNDLYMVVPNYGAETNESGDNLETALASSHILRAHLQRSAINILKFIMTTQVFLENRPCIERYNQMHPLSDSTNGCLIDTQTCHPISSNDTCRIHIQKEGIYTIELQYAICGHSRMQVNFCVLLNGEMIALLSTNGTEGLLSSMKVTKIHLFPGEYEICIPAPDIVDIKNCTWTLL